MFNIIMNISFSLLIYYLLEIIHSLLLIIPILFYFGLIKNNTLFKLIFLIILIIPIHWTFFNNKCALTLLSNNLNKELNNKSFLEKYFDKIFDYFSKNINIPKGQLYRNYITAFLMLDVILMWDLIFRKNKCIRFPN